LPLAGCAAVPIGIGLIPGAPAYLSTVIGNGQSAYETAVDERDSRQQMLDAIMAGHAQAELLRHKDIKADQITAHCYFGKLYLVGEYDSQAQLETIHQCMAKVEGKRAVVTRLYLREDTNGKAGQSGSDMWNDASISASIRTQLLADFEVTSSPVAVEVVQGDIILLGVISCEEERARIMAHALNVDGVNRVVSYLYHQEVAGPTPRVMTAATAATVLERTPSRASSGKKKAARPVRKEAEQPMLMVANPDRGR
jgi:hyperosmotically inducible protein